MTLQHEAWLNLTSEVPLDPDLPICDPHHHLWGYPDSFPESRVRETARPIRHYLLEHLLKDIAGGHNIVQTVFIEWHLSELSDTGTVNTTTLSRASERVGRSGKKSSNISVPSLRQKNK